VTENAVAGVENAGMENAAIQRKPDIQDIICMHRQSKNRQTTKKTIFADNEVVTRCYICEMIFNLIRSCRKPRGSLENMQVHIDVQQKLRLYLSDTFSDILALFVN